MNSPISSALGSALNPSTTSTPTSTPATQHIELIRAEQLTDQAPYAYAAVAVDLVFTAGACPLNEKGETVAPKDIPGQAAKVMDNLETALRAAGAALTDVVKTTVFVASSSRQDLVTAWNVISERFGAHDAPSTLLGVVVLGYPDQLVEVEAIAVRRPRGDSYGHNS